MITPCIKVCKLDPKLELCIGCWRTREEIQDWTAYTDKQREQVVNKLFYRQVRYTSGYSV